MADEKEGAVDAAAEAAPADQPKDKTKSMVIVMIVLAILVMVLTPVITIFAVKAMQHKETAATAAVTSEKKAALEIKLPRIEVNVKDTQGTRIIQVDAFVVVSDATEMSKYFEEQKDVAGKGRIRKINDILITIFTSKNLDGLLSAEAKERIKKEIKDALNEYLRNELHTEGLVTDVYFTRFIVQ